MSKLDSMVHERGYEYFDWNCSSGDAASNSVPAQTIVDNSTNCNYDQIMLLFHDSSPKTSTVEALPAIIETIKVVVMYLKRSVMIHPYSIMESITKSAICWLFLYKKIEGINPRLLLCSTLIDLASIQYFLQPDLHSSQQLLCSYVKV